jgi:hypothetical protein
MSVGGREPFADGRRRQELGVSCEALLPADTELII